MYYEDKPEIANQYLRLALPHIGKHELAVSPCNYTVWYEYVSGINPDLSEQIDATLERDGRIDQQRMDEFYRRHVVRFSEVEYETAREKLRSIVDSLDESVAAAGGNIHQFQDSLSDCAGQLCGQLSEEALTSLVQHLSTETQLVQQGSEALQQQLDNSRKETDQLRKELEHIRHEAHTDPLTGLANRRAFNRCYEEVCDNLDNASSHSVLIADIDHFKKVNDTHGHLIGDRVIRHVAQVLCQHAREKFCVARFGGEEFAIIMVDTPLEQASSLAETIRHSIEKGRLVKSGSREAIGQVTISIGLTALKLGESIDELLERADNALYAAKNGGRNQVICA